MTFATAAKSAALRLNMGSRTAFFGQTDPFCLEICDLGNEVAADAMKANDWRALTREWVITGDGATKAWMLPTDYDRMLLTGSVLRASCGQWSVLAERMQIWPELAAGEMASVFYITRDVVRKANTDPSPVFTADDDTFRLDDRLLTLGLIWRWKAMKGLDYSEDMANYERLLSQIAGREAGGRAYRIQECTWWPGARRAWPWELG